jgi:hypothetical protein
MKHLNFILALAVGVLLSFTFGAFAAQVAGASPILVTTVGLSFVAASFIPKTPVGVLKDDISPDLTAIKKYAVTHKKMLLRSVYNNLDIASDITLQPNVKNKMPIPKLIINGQPGPRTGVHDSEGSGFGYTDRELEVFDFQRDITIDPFSYKDTYLAQYLAPGSGTSNKQIPFAQFTIETFLKQNTAYLNNVTAFFGIGRTAFNEYVLANTYTVGAFVKVTTGSKINYFKAKAAILANESPSAAPAKWENARAYAIAEGLRPKIQTERTAGNLITASTGAITSADGFEQALMTYRRVKEEARNMLSDICLFASSDNVDKISDSFKDDIMKYTSADGKILHLPRTNGKCKIVRASWMAGSNMLIAAPKSALYMGTDLLADYNDLKLIEDVYTIKGGLQGLIGFQLGDLECIAVNDQN